MRNPARVVAAIFAAVVLSTSCDDTPTDAFAGATAEVSPATAALSAIGDTVRLGILVTNGPSVANSAATWTSLDAAVATVDGNGLVSAVSVGSARIVVSVPNQPRLADTATVTVTQVVTSVDISLNGSTTPITAPIAVTAINDSVRLAAVARDSRATVVAGASVSWSSLTPTLASVTPTGIAIAMGNGTARIVATSGARADTITLQVQQTPATVDIRRLGSVDAVVGPVAVGALADTIRFDAVVRDRRANVISGGTITWSTLDPSIVSVANGNAVSVANGNGRVVATSGTSADTVVVQIAQVGSSLALTPATRTFASLQDTASLAAVLRDANGRTMTGAGITWRSTNAAVATVSATGRVTAVANGTATIIADGPGVSGSAAVTVAQAANRVVVAPSALTVDAGATGNLLGNAFDANNNAVVGTASTWTSDNTAVATVGPTGVVTGATVGTANVTFRSGTATAVAAVTVRAPQVASISIAPNPVSLNLETSLVLSPTVIDVRGNAIAVPVVWTTGDASIALVAADGRVTGNGYGTTTVTATLQGVSSSVTVNVTPSVARITIAPVPANLFNGDVFTLAATFLDVRDGAVVPPGPVAWSTTTPLIVTVSPTGGVTVIRGGNANASVSTGGITGVSTFLTRERVSSIFVEPDTVSILVGDNATIVATTLDRFGAAVTGRPMTWASSAPAIATVDATGHIAALSPGVANVTVSSETASTSIPVTVSAVVPPPPPVVTLFAGVAAASPASTTSISLTASTATGGTPGYTYQWYRGLASGFAVNAGSLIVGATALTYTDLGLTQGTPYFYKLVVTDNAAVSVTYAEVNATPGNFNADAGPNQPSGFKRIFVLDGTTTHPNVANPGFTSLAGVQVSAAWSLTGAPISATSRVESVDAVGATDGKAFRHWLLAGDNSNWHGAIFANNIATFTPPGWTAPIGQPRSYYQRVRLRFSPNFQDHPGRFKPLGYLGSGGGGGSADYYLTQKLDDPNMNNKTGLSRQNTGDGGGTTFRQTTAAPMSQRNVWYDVEVLITSQSTLGANDARVQVWINGALLLDANGLHTTPGMNGFQMPLFWGGSGAFVTANMFTDYDLYYLSASGN